jgi:CBS-domain-containing membrane protein
MFLLFVLVAVVYELRTRRIYPDRNRRGTKAAAQAKAKKVANKAKNKDVEANDVDNETDDAEAEDED